LEILSQDPSKADHVKKARANIVQLLNDITEAIKVDELPAAASAVPKIFPIFSPIRPTSSSAMMICS
jgi:hypothetical protein